MEKHCMKKIDINCDLGEGIDNEAAIMPYIQSCNIACGGHAGNKNSMRYVVGLAKEYGVKIGAHPSYPDRENFGRKSISISDRELIDSIKEQLTIFDSVLQQENAKLYHIKPHGALYNDIAKNEHLAKVFLEAIQDYNTVFLYVPYNSVIAKKAMEEGVEIKYEAFADRSYNKDLSLVSRSHPNAVLSDGEQILDQITGILKKGTVKTIDGIEVPIEAHTFCMHSDTENAVSNIQYLYHNLYTAALG